MKTRYNALRFISLALKLLALLVLGISIAVALYFPYPHIIFASIPILVGLIVTLLLWARSDLILVSLDMEAYTRASAVLLKQILARQVYNFPLPRIRKPAPDEPSPLEQFLEREEKFLKQEKVR